MSDIAEVWREYKKTGDPYLQEELVVNYQGLVYKLAHKIVRKLKQGTEVEDLISDGMVGLVKAIEAFEPERGFKFSTYATPVVRGSILNGLRRLDWLPERTRTKARNYQKAVADLEQVTGRKPTEEDIAAHMEISAKEVYDIIADLSSMFLLSLDTPLGAIHAPITFQVGIVHGQNLKRRTYCVQGITELMSQRSWDLRQKLGMTH